MVNNPYHARYTNLDKGIEAAIINLEDVVQDRDSRRPTEQKMLYRQNPLRFLQDLSTAVGKRIYDQQGKVPVITGMVESYFSILRLRLIILHEVSSVLCQSRLLKASGEGILTYVAHSALSALPLKNIRSGRKLMASSLLIQIRFPQHESLLLSLQKKQQNSLIMAAR